MSTETITTPCATQSRGWPLERVLFAMAGTMTLLSALLAATVSPWFLLLTAFVLGLGHLIVNGQQRKWIYTLLASLVGSCACILPGIVISIFSIIDAYQTAQRLQAGETIGENEYTYAPLFKIVAYVDKEATCKNA